MGIARRRDPLEPPFDESDRRHSLRLSGGALTLCVVGLVAGILLQRAHYRGQAGLILALFSAILSVFFALGLVSEWTRPKT